MQRLEELRGELSEPGNTLLLNIDGNNIDQTQIPQIYGPYIRKVKWGTGIPHSHAADHWRNKLAADGILIFYDPKLSDRAPQIPKTVVALEEWGYDRISVNAAGASVAAMVAARRAATKSQIVVDLSPGNLTEQLNKVEAANSELPIDKQLIWMMCDSQDVATVRASGEYAITATGIYVPGTHPPGVETRMTPAEARAAGADEIAIGSSLSYAIGMTEEQAVLSALANLAGNR